MSNTSGKSSLLECSMSDDSGYVLIASMDVEPHKEDLFNQVYDEHVEHLLAVPGVRSVTRLKGEAFNIAIGKEVKPMPAPHPVYTTIYELDSPDVLESNAWTAAVEKGRWASEVRPFTSNRSHSLFKKLKKAV